MGPQIHESTGWPGLHGAFFFCLGNLEMKGLFAMQRWLVRTRIPEATDCRIDSGGSVLRDWMADSDVSMQELLEFS